MRLSFFGSLLVPFVVRFYEFPSNPFENMRIIVTVLALLASLGTAANLTVSDLSSCAVSLQQTMDVKSTNRLRV